MTKLVKKYILISLALIISASAFSQQRKNEFYISGSAGASKLMYQLNTGKNSFQLGGAFGLGYKRFFTENIGISIGLEGALYSGGFKSSKVNYQENVYDNLFKNVDYKAEILNYSEKHSLYAVNLPLLLHFQTSGKHKFYTALGAKLCLPLSFSTRQNPVDKINASGYAPTYNTELNDLEILGYGQFDRKAKVKHSASDLDLKTKLNGILTAELGMKWSLTDKMYLYTAAFVDYGITSVSTINKKDNAKDFLPYYGMSSLNEDNENSRIVINSVLNSRYGYNDKGGVNFTKNDNIRPFIVGVKLALSFGFGDIIGKSSPKSDLVVLAPVAAAAVAVEAVKQVEPVVEKQPEPVVEKKPEPVKVVEPKKPEPVKKEEKVVEVPKKEKRPNRDVKLVIDNYKINGSELSDSWKRSIDETILPLKNETDLYFLLEGHTCDLGSESVNARISLERANAVKNYLISKGFAAERITTIGKGEAFPAVPNTSLKNRLTNRRVVFVITEKK